jgi:hypothetical protein
MRKSGLIFSIILIVLIAGCKNKDKQKEQENALLNNSSALKPDQLEQEKLNARNVSDMWVKIIDSRNFIYAYQQTSLYFKATVPETDWQRFTDSLDVFGTNISRNFRSAEYFQGTADNRIFEYIVCKYDASFTRKKVAVETVSVIREANQWRIMGYFID